MFLSIWSSIKEFVEFIINHTKFDIVDKIPEDADACLFAYYINDELFACGFKGGSAICWLQQKGECPYLAEK